MVEFRGCCHGFAQSLWCPLIQHRYQEKTNVLNINLNEYCFKMDVFSFSFLKQCCWEFSTMAAQRVGWPFSCCPMSKTSCPCSLQKSCLYREKRCWDTQKTVSLQSLVWRFPPSIKEWSVLKLMSCLLRKQQFWWLRKAGASFQKFQKAYPSKYCLETLSGLWFVPSVLSISPGIFGSCQSLDT